MSSTVPALRIGILGCANIAKKNAIAILASGECCCIAAIASRKPEKAQAFLHDFLASRLPSNQQPGDIACFGGSSAYDDLIESSCVDALYVPLPTNFHKEWVIKALTAGKHVLLEKPVALSANDYEEMLAVAQKHNKWLQDGTMFVHHPRTANFAKAVHDTSNIWTLKRIEGSFSFCGDEAFFKNDIRTKNDGDPHGCVGDLGWYVIRLALLAVDNDIVASAQVVDYQLNDEGVPIDATCLIKFQNGVVLSFHCGYCSQFRQYVHVVGTEACASMNDFVLPTEHPVKYQIESMSLTDFDLITQNPCHIEEFGGPVQEVLMWRNFSRFAKAMDEATNGWNAGDSNDCHEAVKLSQMSIANQKVVDLLMASIHRGGSKVEA